MAPKLLEILKKGLVKFTEAIKTHKTKLSEKLAQAETISSSDEHWTIRWRNLSGGHGFNCGI